MMVVRNAGKDEIVVAVRLGTSTRPWWGMKNMGFFCLIPFFTSLIASASNTFLFVYKRRNDTFKFTNYRFVRSAHDHGKTIAQLVFQWSVYDNITSSCFLLFCKSAFLNVLILPCVTLSFVKLCTYKSFSGRKEFMGLTMAFPILTSTVCISVWNVFKNYAILRKARSIWSK